MTLDEIRHSLKKVNYPITSSYSLPPACYHDVDWEQLEQERLFSLNWFSIGRIDQWKCPGDYLTLKIGNKPVVIVMDNDNQLKAFSNTCLHRSSEILQGAGRCKAMVCPFHGWSYDFSGKVISAPRMESATNFNIEHLRLKQFSVEVSDGFVFLNLSADPNPLEEWLEDFSDFHLPWSLDNLVTTRQRVLEVNCNWKLFIEVFNEYYHLPYVHPQSINGRYPEPDPVDVVMGQYTTQFGVTSGNPALLDGEDRFSLPSISTLDDRQKSGTRYTWVYPNLTFAASWDCMWMYHVFPLDSNRTQAVQTICFPRETTLLPEFDEIAEQYYQRFDLAIDEDIPALEQQQSGMESPYAVQGRFSSLEPSVGNFACWYAEMVK